MPTLFISYKRGTTAIAFLKEKLEAARYRLWLDWQDINMSEADWRDSIDRGLAQCGGVILGVTPAACQSPQVRYEVSKALELGKPIFAVILERIADKKQAHEDLGLPPRQELTDLTDVPHVPENIARLLDELNSVGLRVTPHELRRQRDPDNPQYLLHQKYLQRLVEGLDSVPLAQINPDQSDRVDLEAVYVDSPTPLTLSVELKNWQVVDWWLSRADRPERGVEEFRGDKTGHLPQARPKPEEWGYERPPFEALVGGLEQEIELYRQANPDARPDKEYSRRYDRNSWNDGIQEDVVSLHLHHLAAGQRRLVVLGAPGSGKSTFVRYLALCLAGSELDGWTRPTKVANLDNWPHGPLTPIYVELRRFVASAYFPASLNETATADHLWAYIENELLPGELQPFAPDLRYDLEQGQALLILDGLDEVPYPENGLTKRREQLIGLARSLDTRYNHSRVIVTSRPYAYEGWTLKGYESVTIAPFEDKHRVELARQLYRAVGLPEEQAEGQARRLNQELRNIDPQLKDRPLFVTLMATLYHKRGGAGLPTRRGTLYRESILLLLERWTKSKPGRPALTEILGDKTPQQLYDRLAALAYEVHQRGGEQPGTPEIDYELLHRHLKPLGRHVAVDLIPYLCENAGVLVSPGQNEEADVFHFAHRTFQEYLAAQHIIELCQKADSFALVKELITSKPLAWRIPCAMTGDVLADTDRKSDLWLLLGDLLENDPPTRQDDPQWWAGWLAGRIAFEQELYAQAKLHRRTEQPVREALVEWLVALLRMPQALKPVERAECGQILAWLGDPRPGVGVTTLNVGGQTVELPQIEWCGIPAPPGGKIWLGADDQEDNLRREVELDYGFQMAKYLVTYRQFEAFSESGEYDEPRWWAGFPAEYQPQSLDYDEAKPGSYPRDNVSWYQAAAFTRWLTTHYRAAGELASDVEIRLPTRTEWEYAARGTDERINPYPGPFDPTKVNTDETDINRSSVVGCFPDGASPFGVLDMSGNLWEWCWNKYSNNSEARELRGGSFYDYVYGAAGASRSHAHPYSSNYYLGFRVVVAAPNRASDL